MARDPVTGENYKVDGSMSFAEWKDSLSEEQRAVMRNHVDNSAARAAVRNTHKTLTFNKKASFDVRFDNLPENVNKGISEACLKVAELGGEQGIEYLSLINLETGKEDFFESGDEFSVGSRKFWEYIKDHKDDKFAFIHNHNTDGYFSETDMTTFLYNEPIHMFGAIRIDGVKYFAEKKATLDKSVHFDELFENELKDLNYRSRHGIISGGERTRLREEIIVDNLLEKYTKGLIEIDGK